MHGGRVRRGNASRRRPWAMASASAIARRRISQVDGRSGARSGFPPLRTPLRDARGCKGTLTRPRDTGEVTLSIKRPVS
ncbi:hypothetical protein AK812_SmicGene2160 [Symbiodinium microadriaticum]|uniref:Uncharacterized protein n=1 Tax=Symbiodinium microadriaticum TaxID=2951 RepID=A0A1Q9F269_SYMMI|nr:hypothetical protein AK812_SmicGene2160 [Symbiodinium microadriaticum]